MTDAVPVDPADLPTERLVRLLTGADFWALHAEPALGLRRIVTSDGPAGVRGELWDERDPSVNIPSPTALAASWDPGMVRGIGGLLAEEARRKRVDVLLGPTVNIQRTPLGGRHFECFSEDPLLTSRLAVAYITGVQEHGVAATVKHVVGNDFERQRFTADVRVDERTLREVYLQPFEAAVTGAGVWAAMAAYNSVRGTTMTENPLLELLRGWGFDGVVMSDWFAARSLAAATAELDLVMPGPTTPWGSALVDAVADGRVPREAVVAKVRRLLRLGERVGAAGPDATPGVEPGRFAPAPTPERAAAVAAHLRSATAAGFVLLGNRPVAGAPVLPLDPAARRVALIGDHATHPRVLGGGSAFVFPTGVVTPADGLRAALGDGVRLDVVAGAPTTSRIGAPELADLRVPGADRPGVEIRFLGDGDRELGRVERTSTTYNWNNAFGDGVEPARLRAVEARTVYRAATSGRHVLGCSGTGRYRLLLDGVVVLDRQLALPVDADGVEGLTRPPQAGHEVELAEGAEVDVVVRHDVDPERRTDDMLIVPLQVNASRPRPDTAQALRTAEEAARAADVAVVVVGTTEESEGEGFDRDELDLPGAQDELVRRVAAANPRTVVVVNAGAPVLLPWRDEVAAVLVSWLPGQEFGSALADVLLGVVEPGGRLPMTWPGDTADPIPSTVAVDGVVHYSEGLHVGHRRYLRDGVRPAYWFGHGLGYTSWAYEGLVVRPEPAGVAVEVAVRNTGARPGREVVQVYLARPESALERPARWLAGFAAATAGPGERVTVRIALPERVFAHWDESAGDWAVEPGEFAVRVGRHADDAALTATVAPRPQAVPSG
ncbi:glycoside hydrolase family 3 protein [Pseudonocardia humida]|uniref:Glycoside hydrolase family 3 protein n=1 Tax=Pseudonocardia humida TaxID=2800819 RepID=A0ABT0ZTJ3_9PSEU|nr:glycoside hydrolase family 3 C-terminal domain-containing protein [Pseudonocardia humida]MCO1654032.1 glycoside hydrolase family 3 protein [Pseudonocardia humida]